MLDRILRIGDGMFGERNMRKPRLVIDRLQVVRDVRSFHGDFNYWARRVGWRAAFAWATQRRKSPAGFPPNIKFKPRQAKHPLVARLRSPSDMNVFDQIFRFDEYACIRNIPSPKLILDLGANVGYSSAYFLTCFPDATVVAVEPDSDNFELCRENLIGYGDRARLVLGAAWSKRSRLRLSRGTYRDGLEWAIQVHECGDGEEATVDGWDIPGLLNLVGAEEVDLLKIDIERSELDLFSASSSSWLPKVRNICIELHGADCSECFFRAVGDFEFDLELSGELTICRNLRHKAQPSEGRIASERGLSGQHPRRAGLES